MSLGAPGNRTSPVANSIGRPSAGNAFVPPAGAPLVSMSNQALPPAGGSLPHNNMQPYLTVNFCIALQGVFPPRG
jgi:microcystin-dependent protein